MNNFNNLLESLSTYDKKKQNPKWLANKRKIQNKSFQKQSRLNKESEEYIKQMHNSPARAENLKRLERDKNQRKSGSKDSKERLDRINSMLSKKKEKEAMNTKKEIEALRKKYKNVFTKNEKDILMKGSD